MRKEFDKIKKRYTLLSAAYSIAGGILCGLAVAGIALIIFKLCAVQLGWYIYLAIGAGTAVIACPVIFLIIRPTDGRLARKLDKTYALDEKMQTMVEYSDKQGVMLDMQRQDADASLRSLPRKKPSLKGIISSIVAAVIAVALFVTGIVVPQKTDIIVPPEPEPPYTVPEAKLLLLNNLISDVSGDDYLDGDLKTSYLETLDGLYESITAEDITEESVLSDVRTAMYAISQASINANSYDNIAKLLSDNNSSDANTDTFGEALRNSVKVYSETLTAFSSYDDLSNAKTSFNSQIYAHLSAAAVDFYNEVTALTDTTSVEAYKNVFNLILTDESLADYYNALFTEGGLTYGSLRNSSATSGNDLYDCVYDFYRTMNYCLNSYNNGNMEFGTVITNLTTGSIYYNVNNFAIYATTAMEGQAYTYMADYYVRQTLASVFEITVVGYGWDDGTSSSGDSGDSGDGSGGTGGGGTGELIVNSEYIYNPDTGEYVLFTDVMDELYAILNDDSYSDEVKEYIRNYINNLITTES